MARVTYEEVQAILENELASSTLEAFIEAATAWVDANLVTGCTALSETVLTQIEKFLAAHLATTVDPLLVSASRGDISETYQRGKDGFSQYLHMAAALDSCGLIKAAFMGKPRLIFKVGTTYTAEAT